MLNNHTYVGLYDSSTDNFYNIYKSDASIKELKELQTYKSILPGNSIIISSPVDNTFSYDINAPAIAVTDSYGGVLPLTYSFNPEYFAINEENNSVQFSENIKNELDFKNSSEYTQLQKKYESLEKNFNSLMKSYITLVLDEKYTVFFDNSYNISITSEEIPTAEIKNNFKNVLNGTDYTSYGNIYTINYKYSSYYYDGWYSTINLNNTKGIEYPLNNNNLCITFDYIDIYHNTEVKGSSVKYVENRILCENDNSTFNGYLTNKINGSYNYTPGIVIDAGYLNIYLSYHVNKINIDKIDKIINVGSYEKLAQAYYLYNSYISNFNCLSFYANGSNVINKVNLGHTSNGASLCRKNISANVANADSYIDVDVIYAKIPINNIDFYDFDFNLKIPSYLKSGETNLYFESDTFDLRIKINSTLPPPTPTPTETPPSTPTETPPSTPTESPTT